MKKAMLLAALTVVACASPEADKAAMDSAAMAAGPAPLTATDLTGTWAGTSWAEGTDSIVGTFTVISETGTDSKAKLSAVPDTIHAMHAFDADSVVATSMPYVDPTIPNKPQVTFRAVGRMMGGKLVGTSAVMLASKPDSVLGRIRYEMTKSP